jgi:hypothetical protein
MEIPATISERFPFLDALYENWEPVSRSAFYGWLSFYGLLIGNALFGGQLFHARVLEHDRQIAAIFRMFGWLGILSLVAWFSWRSCMPESVSAQMFHKIHELRITSRQSLVTSHCTGGASWPTYA